MQPLSMISSSYSTSGATSSWTLRAESMNRPSDSFMMLALWNTVTLRRPRCLA